MTRVLRHLPPAIITWLLIGAILAPPCAGAANPCNPAPCTCDDGCTDAALDDRIAREQQIVCGERAVRAVLALSPEARADQGYDVVMRYPGDVLVVRATDPARVPAWRSLEARVADAGGTQPEANHSYQLQAPPTPNDPGFLQQWPLAGKATDKSCTDVNDPFCAPDCHLGAMIGAEGAWDEIGVPAPIPTVVIGIVDALPVSLDDLEANLWKNPNEVEDGDDDGDSNGIVDDVHGFNAVNGMGITHSILLAEAGSTKTHGTSVASIVGAIGNNNAGFSGVMWRTQLAWCKATDTAGQLAGCLGYFASLRADGVPLVAVNVSLGGNGCSCCVESQIRRLRDWGVLVVAAAGNEGCGNGPRDPTTVVGCPARTGACQDCPMYPASHGVSNLLSVGASTCSGAPLKCSNYGLRSVHLFAPGNNIATLSNPLFSMTSAAAPHVTGAIGLVKATMTGSGFDWRQLRNRALAGGQLFGDLIGAAHPAPLARGASTITGRYLQVSAPPSAGPRSGMLTCVQQPVRRRIWPTANKARTTKTEGLRLAAIDVVCGSSQGPIPVEVHHLDSHGGPPIETLELLDAGAPPDECSGDGEHTGTWSPREPGSYRLRFWSPPDATEDLEVEVVLP